MNREEQKQILAFVKRAVTGTPGAPLPALDLEADAIIRALFVRNPEAAYRITRLAMAMERELEALRGVSGTTAEPTSPGRVAWFFTRRKTGATRQEPQLPVLEVTTSG